MLFPNINGTFYKIPNAFGNTNNWYYINVWFVISLVHILYLLLIYRNIKFVPNIFGKFTNCNYLNKNL